MTHRQHIKRGVTTSVGTDIDDQVVAQVEHNGKTTSTEIVMPYGLFGNPPLGSDVLMMNVMDQEENKAGFAHCPELRPRLQGEGAAGVGNFLTLDSITFTPDGGAVLSCLSNGLNITVAPDLITKVAGALIATIAGNLTIAVAGDVAIAVGGNGSFNNDNGNGEFNFNVKTHLGGVGGKPIARVGDLVQMSNGLQGTIISGSPNHTST